MASRSTLLTQLTTEIADITSKVEANITQYPNKITGAELKLVLQDMRDSLNTLIENTLNSHFNLTTDTTDAIIEGSTNWFCSETHFLQRLNATNTTELPEGSNLYYTQARVDLRVEALKPKQGTISNVTGSQTVTVTSTPQAITMIDAEARSTINTIITALKAANIIA